MQNIVFQVYCTHWLWDSPANLDALKVQYMLYSAMGIQFMETVTWLGFCKSKKAMLMFHRLLKCLEANKIDFERYWMYNTHSSKKRNSRNLKLIRAFLHMVMDMATIMLCNYLVVDWQNSV